VKLCLMVAVCALTTTVAAADPGAAQAPVEGEHSFWHVFPAIGMDFVHLVSTDSASVLAIGGVGATAAHMADTDVEVALSTTDWVDTAFKPAQPIGLGFVQIGAAAATYVTGRLAGKPRRCTSASTCCARSWSRRPSRIP
jgi:hypothetical protein